MMDDRDYQRLADEAFRRIEDGFKDVDPDVVDFERTQGDVLTLTFAGGKRCIINTQRPTRQIWMAANARAWHFSFDPTRAVWHDDKEPQSELFATLTKVVHEVANVTVTF